MKNNNLLSPKLPWLLWLLLGLWSQRVLAETGPELDLTGHWAGYAALSIFILAYELGDFS